MTTVKLKQSFSNQLIVNNQYCLTAQQIVLLDSVGGRAVIFRTTHIGMAAKI